MLDNDYEAFLKENERLRQEYIKTQCSQGNHVWTHQYCSAVCSYCGESHEIPTPQDHLHDH